MTDTIAISLIGAGVLSIVSVCAFWYGCYIGYKAGAEYGMSKLKEYHEFTIGNIEQTRKQL